MEWQIPDPFATARVPLIDGGSIALRRHGNPNGPRLVISHANGLSSDAYFPFWSLLVEQYDVVVYDLRDHGVNPVGDLVEHNGIMMVQDSRRITRAIDRHFGKKPKVGVFHSLSAGVAFLHSVEEDAYEALVLFDPVICPPGIGRREKLRAMGQSMAKRARQRQSRFSGWEELAQSYRHAKEFQRIRPGVADLLARTTLRPASEGVGYELCCPPAYEAQILERMYEWSTVINLEALRCPVKVIGGDPLVPFTFLPTTDPDLIVQMGYDFVPETTHFLQLEEPEECVRLMVEFLATLGNYSTAPPARKPAEGPPVMGGHALNHVEGALRLVDLEQRGLLEKLSGYLDTVRHGSDLSELRQAARSRLDRLEEYLGDLAARCRGREMDAHNTMMTRQKLFTWLEQQVFELCEVLHTLPPRPPLNTWSQALVEGIDVALLVLIDTLQSGDAAAWPSTTQLVNDRTQELHKLRDTTLKDEPALVSENRKKVLELVSIAEHVFLLMSRLAHDYRQASRVDEAFLEHADEALSTPRVEAFVSADG